MPPILQIPPDPLTTSHGVPSKSSRSFISGFFVHRFCDAVRAKLQRLHHHPKRNETLKFLVIGDWGRKGEYNQSLVANEMGKMGEKLDIDFVVSTGDNIYEDGLRNVTDPAFVQSFNDIYTAKLRASKSHGTLF
ncbi:hypothetical protein K1719_042311 [Acacia pycnantha]|nr:hypothetical protein K1719_042311 [Acacia pycnantha]